MSNKSFYLDQNLEILESLMMEVWVVLLLQLEEGLELLLKRECNSWKRYTCTQKNHMSEKMERKTEKEKRISTPHLPRYKSQKIP